MNKLNRSLGAWFAATVIAASAQAQPNAGGRPVPSERDRPVVPLYRIEVIVFAYEDADPTEERFRVRAASDRAGSARDVDSLAEFDFESAASDLSAAAIEPEADEQSVGGEGDFDAGAEPGADSLGVGAGAVADDNAGLRPRSNEAFGAQSATVPGFTPDGFPDEPGWITRPSRRGQPAFKFRILAPEELQLGGEYGRLQRIDAYTPLLHGGWIQQALPETESQPFDLTYLGTLNPMGTVQLHINRFLRVTLDLSYRPSPQQNARLSSIESSFGLSELALAPRLPLSTERNVRSRELHYFDHPYFGVLVMVAPYEPAAASPPGEVGPAA
jgi:hypothetical protein